MADGGSRSSTIGGKSDVDELDNGNSSKGKSVKGLLILRLEMMFSWKQRMV